jgi:predicted nucleotidyltransferase
MQKLPIVDESYIAEMIERFKAALRDQSLTEKLIVQKYIIHGTPYIFKDNENKYFDLKHEIATNFNEHFECVRMIGSAKLGFSIAPRKLWRSFSDESDIDIAIISQSIFEQFWIDLYDFNISLTSRTEKEQKSYRDFLEYLFKGWLRPDLFPFKYLRKNEWFDFFKSISYKYGYQKIACAIYYSDDFFEKYHTLNIKNLRQGYF